MVVRDDVGAPPGRDDRDLQELGEAGQLGRGTSAQDAATGQDDRASGGGQELDDGADLVVGRASDAGVGWRPRPASSGIVSSSRSSGSDNRTPGRAGRVEAWRVASATTERRRRPCAAQRPTAPADRASRPGRSPGTPRDPGTHARPGRPRRTSASSPGGRCGCRWRGWIRRRRACRDRRPAVRSADRGPRP